MMVASTKHQAHCACERCTWHLLSTHAARFTVGIFHPAPCYHLANGWEMTAQMAIGHARVTIAFTHTADSRYADAEAARCYAAVIDTITHLDSQRDDVDIRLDASATVDIEPSFTPSVTIVGADALLACAAYFGKEFTDDIERQAREWFSKVSATR